MLNISSVNMPKIKPETKGLIIKTLKTSSTCPKRQVERIRKRYQETGDVHDRPRSGRPRKTTARDGSLLVRLSKARPMSTASQLQEEWTPATVSSRTVRRHFCSQWFPRSYCCPETSAKQETAKKPCCVRQGPQPDGRLDSRKVAKNLFFRLIVS